MSHVLKIMVEIDVTPCLDNFLSSDQVDYEEWISDAVGSLQEGWDAWDEEDEEVGTLPSIDFKVLNQEDFLRELWRAAKERKLKEIEEINKKLQ